MDFSAETWACIDVIKRCRHIDFELKNAQIMLRRAKGNFKSSTLIQRKKYIGLLKNFGLLPNEEKHEIDFFDIIDQSIKNNFFVLTKQLLRRHILRDRIHENNNKILIALIQKENNDLIQYLLTLPKMKATLVDPKNSVLMEAVLRNMVEVVDFFLAMPEIKKTVHKNKNTVLFEAMRHPDLIIFRKLILLPKVKENFNKIMPRIYEFLNPEILANAKIDLGLEKFSESEIINYAIEVSRAGHVLGLSNDYLPSNTIFPMHFSGTYDGKSLGWILENLRGFLRNTPDSELKKITNIIFYVFKTCQFYREKMFDRNHNEKRNHQAHQNLAKHLFSNKMLYLISRWINHSVGIILYKINQHQIFLAVTNRGIFGDCHFGTKIYKVKTIEELTANWIREIQIAKTYEKFSSLLNLIIDVERPLLCLPQKEQKYSTCGYANKIAAIEAMLLLFHAKFSDNFFKKRGLKKIFVLYGRYDYKKIASAFRDQEINRIIEMIKSNQFHSDLIYDLVRSIILQHPGQTDETQRPEKFEVECQRARKLLYALPVCYQDKFRATYPDLSRMIGFETEINLPQKWVLVAYRRERTSNKTLSFEGAGSPQIKANSGFKYRY